AQLSGLEHADLVASEVGVGRQDGDVLDHRLSDEQPIEGIAMMVRERRHPQRVRELDRKDANVVVREASGDVLRRRLRKLELARSPLDGDLPCTRGREQQLGTLVLQEPPGTRAQTLRRSSHPEPHLRVEENPQDPKSSRTSSGRGASKSSAITTRPRSRPGTRRPAGRPKGTKRATGFPDRAITTSSPRATRASKRERWVLASWTL